MVEQLQSSRTGAFSAQGRRMTMEDAHVLIEDFVEKGWIYGGIFDGHGGSVAARYGADHLHHDLARALERGIEIEQAFSRAYQEVARRLENERSGSTAATFLVTDHEVVSANVGDARTILVREKELVQLSTDHRLDIPEEKDRISRSGGSVQYPYACSKGSCIMPTRTLGDRLVRDIGIISSPFIKTQSRSAED
ncbi:MAG: PP2C family serine/threonine-protein phosphatase, partial [Desulfovibrionales bacterium]